MSCSYPNVHICHTLTSVSHSQSSVLPSTCTGNVWSHLLVSESWQRVLYRLLAHAAPDNRQKTAKQHGRPMHSRL